MRIKANPISSMTKTAYGLSIIAVVLMIINVVLSARLSQDGLMIDTLGKKSITLKASIREMEQDLLAKTSLKDLSAEAAIRGYVAPTSQITVHMSDTFAFKQ